MAINVASLFCYIPCHLWSIFLSTFQAVKSIKSSRVGYVCGSFEFLCPPSVHWHAKKMYSCIDYDIWTWCINLTLHVPLLENPDDDPHWRGEAEDPGGSAGQPWYSPGQRWAVSSHSLIHRRTVCSPSALGVQDGLWPHREGQTCFV